MKVEMNRFSIDTIENDAIFGSFRLKNYKDLRVEFKCKNGEIEFSYLYEDEKEKTFFSEWLSKEKDFYTLFILNYLNEIDKINDICSFKGEIIEEYCYMEEYYLLIQCDELPNKAILIFRPSNGIFRLLYQIPIPIDSEGEYSEAIHIEDILEYETIQRMWDPFRSKTKYRLQLLHLLR